MARQVGKVRVSFSANGFSGFERANDPSPHIFRTSGVLIQVGRKAFRSWGGVAAIAGSAFGAFVRFLFLGG